VIGDDQPVTPSEDGDELELRRFEEQYRAGASHASADKVDGDVPDLEFRRPDNPG
jgi:hypothetical protein